MDKLGKKLQPLKKIKLGKKKKSRIKEIENYLWLIKNGVIGNLRYIGINLRG